MGGAYNIIQYRHILLFVSYGVLECSKKVPMYKCSQAYYELSFVHEFVLFADGCHLRVEQVEKVIIFMILFVDFCAATPCLTRVVIIKVDTRVHALPRIRPNESFYTSTAQSIWTAPFFFFFLTPSE